VFDRVGLVSDQLLSAPAGVLPDPVIKNPASQGLLAFLGLAPDATAAATQRFLADLTEMIGSLKEPDEAGRSNFSACVGFGPSFFQTGGNPRFGLGADSAPVGLRNVPALTNVAATAMPTDIVIYAMANMEADFATLLRFLAFNRGTVAQVAVERGYQRSDRREQFGFLDGLRNVPTKNRLEVITTTDEIEPDGPRWAIGGTYMTYMKIVQDVSAAQQLGVSGLEAAVGRRQVDGSRLDQSAGMGPREEGDFPDGSPAVSSHVRKAGPRGLEQQGPPDVFLFRRGIPFVGLNPDDTLVAGLQFISFSASVDYPVVVWNRWIMNPDFPTVGTGIDQLFQNNLLVPSNAAFFFVPPDDSRFIGASIFSGPESPVTAHPAKVVVRKIINGSDSIKSLKGFGFRIFDAAGNPVGPEFFTNSAGHAVSPELPVGQALNLQETTNPLQAQGLQPAQAQIPVAPIDPIGPPQVIQFINQFPAPPPPGYR
jgi:Dyp-type peroxidase family